MFKRRAFLHWYMAEGMDSLDFEEASQKQKNLIAEYEDVQDKELSELVINHPKTKLFFEHHSVCFLSINFFFILNFVVQWIFERWLWLGWQKNEKSILSTLPKYCIQKISDFL